MTSIRAAKKSHFLEFEVGEFWKRKKNALDPENVRSLKPLAKSGQISEECDVQQKFLFT